MALILVEHPVRLPSTAAVAAFYRALGAKTVTVGRWHTRDASAIDRLIDAIEGGAQATFEFEDAPIIGDDAWTALESLAFAVVGCLDVATPSADFRVWPTHAWVIAPLPPDRLAEVARALGTSVHLKPGVNQLGETRVTVNPAVYWSVQIDASVPTALRAFRVLAGVEAAKGSMSAVDSAVRECLRNFLRAFGGTVAAELELDVDAAAALVDAVPAHALELQAAGAIVRLPAGTITTWYTFHQGGETNERRERKRELGRVSTALREAGIRS